METNMFRIMLFAAILLLNYPALGQKPVKLTEAKEIIAFAKNQLDQGLQAEGEITEFVAKKQIKGHFNVDLSFDEKGKVVSVFFVEKQAPDLRTVTVFRNYLNEYRFNIKAPKGRKYKFNFDFNFN